jgi:hypothetical protein
MRGAMPDAPARAPFPVHAPTVSLPGMSTRTRTLALAAALLACAPAHAWTPENAPRRIDRMRVVVEYVDASAPSGAVVFLGDSHLHRLAVAAVAERPVNLAYGGQTAEQVAEALPGYASPAKARAIVLMIGTNDLLRGEHDALPGRLKSVLAALPAGVPLVWSGVPPLNGKPQKINETIRALCASRRGCTYVGAPSALLKDKVHMAPAGVAEWVRALRAALPADVRSGHG